MKLLIISASGGRCTFSNVIDYHVSTDGQFLILNEADDFTVPTQIVLRNTWYWTEITEEVKDNSATRPPPGYVEHNA